MTRKPHADVFPADFPCELATEAFVHRGEAAWRPRPAVASIEWFAQHRYAVLGTEVFIPQNGGLQSLPYFQNVNRQQEEDWDAFVTRAAAETIAYLRAFEQEFAAAGDAYVNLTWTAESEFQNSKTSDAT